MNTCKIQLTLMLALLGMTQAVAQEYEYVPFVREGVKWVYYYDSPFETVGDEFIPQGRHYYTLELKGDTVIDGKHYKPMHLYSGDAINEESDTIPVYLREENKVVYALVTDDKRYAECPIGIGEDCLVTYRSVICPIVTGQEYILYDFNDPAGLYEYHDPYCGLYSYIGSYQVLIGARLRKCHSFSTSGMAFSGYVIEGIGYAGGDPGGTPLCYFYPYITGLQVIYVLSHVIENGEIIYRQADLEQLLQPDDYEYVPFVREGVKWVYYFINENVLYPPDENLPEGITTYTLELKGDTVINGKTYKAMHKYYGGSINWDNDTVPVYLREEDKVVYAIVPDGRRYYDCPLGNHFFCSIDPYSGEEYVLYDFQNPEEFWNSIMNEYEDGVYEPCGNDTITVGHYKAKRHIGWAMGRNEYDKFYSIEGIGLDSWRPGTPLCFFKLGTPWPAPVFFSHVIEDGEIIYKSVYNYRPDVPGDVDGDGEVTIADANGVIDIVVMGGNAGHTRIPASDVNGDGEVNIADVNAIIDLILRNN